jgi:hypothetical protein
VTTLSDFISEHFHVPPIGAPALICNRCGRDDIDAVTVHMENDHGIDTDDVDVDPARRERCWLTTDHHGRRLPTDRLVENVLLSIFDRLFDLSKRITEMSEQQTPVEQPTSPDETPVDTSTPDASAS